MDPYFTVGNEEWERGTEVEEVVVTYWRLLDGHLVGIMIYLGPIPGQVCVQEAIVYLSHSPPVPDQFLLVVAVEEMRHLAAADCCCVGIGGDNCVSVQQGLNLPPLFFSGFPSVYPVNSIQ